MKSSVAAQLCRGRYLDGHLRAESAIDESRLVALAFRAPGVNAQRREIADIAFRPTRAKHKILRARLALRSDAIQFHPAGHAHPGGASVIGQRLRQIHGHEASDNPAREIALLLGVREHQQPIFLLRGGRLGRARIIVGLIRRRRRLYIHHAALEQRDRSIAPKLKDARAIAAGIKTQIRQHLGMRCGLHRHLARFSCKRLSFLPQVGGKHVAQRHPTFNTLRRAYLQGIPGVIEDCESIAETRVNERLAHLRVTAPHGHLARSGKHLLKRRGIAVRAPISDAPDNSEHSDAEDESLHSARSPKVMPMARAACT